MVVERPPKAQDDARANPQARPGRYHVEGAVCDEDETERGRQPADVRRTAPREGLIDDLADDESRQHLEHAADHGDCQIAEEPDSVRLGETPRASEHG